MQNNGADCGGTLPKISLVESQGNISMVLTLENTQGQFSAFFLCVCVMHHQQTCVTVNRSL